MLSASETQFESPDTRCLSSSSVEKTCRFGAVRVPYFFGQDLTRLSAEWLSAMEPSHILVVHDEALPQLTGQYQKTWRQLAPVSSYPLRASEVEKSLDRMGDLMRWAIERGADRRSLIVAIGGGTVGNVAGLAAHLLFRGIRLVHVPTTYMAAFDSVLSQKQAVNGNGTKNLVGAFHAPSVIFCDCRFFETLPPREIRAGLAESVKNALIAEPGQAEALLSLPADPRSYEGPEHRMIWRMSINAKMPRIETDPKDTGDALIFEYGHTVGHAIEAAAAGELQHGEAVAMGLRAAAHVGHTVFGLDKAFADMHHALLDHFRLPRCLPPGLSLNAIEHRIRKDNKRGYLRTAEDELAMVIASAPGQARLTDGQPLMPVPIRAAMEACATLSDG